MTGWKGNVWEAIEEVGSMYSRRDTFIDRGGMNITMKLEAFAETLSVS